MTQSNDPRPDPAALAALLERVANALDNHIAGLEFEGLVRVSELVRADAAALRAWAPLLVAAVQVADESLSIGLDVFMFRAYAEQLKRWREAVEAYRAALAPGAGAGEGERD